MFELVSKFSPKGDQKRAIEELSEGIIKDNKRYQVLLGATGTGKTFTISNVIKNVNKPTIVMAHNKTLAGQLYAELKEFLKTVEVNKGSKDKVNLNKTLEIFIKIIYNY